MKSLSLVVALSALCSLSNAAMAEKFIWPNGAKAAVNLAYDDALDSQLDNAIPTLNKYGLRGSFYLNVAAPSLTTRLNEWRDAANKGHELGNHSIFHQCSKGSPGRDWVHHDHDLDNISVGHMQNQVKVTNAFLHAIDGKKERTYTPPCIDVNASGKNYVDGLKSEFIAVKGLGGAVTPSMKGLNPYSVPVDFPVEMTGKQLIDIVKKAAKKGTMANFTFHGIGGDHMVVSSEAHEELVKYLADNKDIYWTDSFINIMSYVKQQQEKTHP